MKTYGSLIALAVVAVLAVVFVTTRDEPAQTVEAPYSIAKVENLARLELTRPGDELVVLAKKDGSWMLTKPLEAPVAEEVAAELDEAFAKSISTDDLALSAEKAADYELDPEHAVKVALYAEGADAPSAQFSVGKSLEVPGTRAERTFIKTTDGKVFRARTDLGDVLRRDVESLRSRQIQKYDRAAITEVTVNYQDGTSVTLKKKGTEGDGWTLTEPAIEMELEKSRVSALLSNLANLVANGFADDKKPADVGLEPAFAEVVAKVDGETRRVLVSAPVEGEKKYYAKKPNAPHIYTISKTTGDALTPTPLTLRNRLVLDVNQDAITRMEFDGEDRAVVEKQEDGTWKLVRPKSAPVKESALSSRLSTFAQLRAIRFEDEPIAETGLNKPSTRLTFTADGKSHTLLVGDEADKKGNLYAKWQDSELIMVVPQWIKERASTEASALTEDET